MKLFGWLTASPGLDRIRVQLPFEELARHGHQVESGSVFERHHGDSDTIVGARVSLAAPSRLWTHACGMMGGPFCVFETDDDNLGISRYNRWGPFQFWGNPEHRFFYLANMRVSHRIVTSTPYLQDLLTDQTGHPDIVVAPNAIPGWMLDLPPYQSPDGSVTVGWAGGASHEGDWAWVKDGVRRALVLCPGSRVQFVGQDFTRTMRLPADRVSHVPWFETTDDYWRKGLNFDVGLAPLRPEGFNKAKSPIKLQEYAARGIPVVASNYGPYRDFVQDGVTGFLVSKPKDWTEKIKTLIDDVDLRQRMGVAAKEQAAGYTIERLWPRYEEAFTP